MIALEQQLERLAELGLTLDPGITIDDLLYSFDRAAYQDQPYDLLLFMFGSEVEREPWGRAFCSRVWNFDTECINGDGAYTKIVSRLCGCAGMPNLLTNVRDSVDLQARRAWLSYSVDGRTQRWDVEVRDDWADLNTVCYVMDDIERDGRHFYAKDNGQAMVLFYLDHSQAAGLNELSGGALTPMLAQ